MAMVLIVEVLPFHWYPVYPVIIKMVNMWKLLSEKKIMLNPENVGDVLIKSMDYCLKAVKRKTKLIPILVIYAYYIQRMPNYYAVQ